MSKTQAAYYKSPIGVLEIKGDNEGIQSVLFVDDARYPELVSGSHDEIIVTPVQNCVTQLNEYFSGDRTEFDLKLNPEGTTFQQKVWAALGNIPFEKTRSYIEQTKTIGDIKAIRAVASANGKNPISIIIPCHRVIGSDGSLTGYAGGIWRKKWLLEHESGNKQQLLF